MIRGAREGTSETETSLKQWDEASGGSGWLTLAAGRSRIEARRGGTHLNHKPASTPSNTGNGWLLLYENIERRRVTMKRVHNRGPSRLFPTKALMLSVFQLICEVMNLLGCIPSIQIRYVDLLASANHGSSGALIRCKVSTSSNENEAGREGLRATVGKSRSKPRPGTSVGRPKPSGFGGHRHRTFG